MTRSRRAALGAQLAVLGAILAAPSPAAAQWEEDEEELAAVFDAAPVSVDPRFRAELRAGLAMPEQASRMRLTSPVLGAGFTGRPARRVRLDGGYLFTWSNQGTSAVSVLNTHHLAYLRAHWLFPAGPSWFSLGLGPAVTVSSVHAKTGGETAPVRWSVGPGAAIAGGVETEVAGRVFRVEAGVQSRLRRVDLLFLAGVAL